MTDKGFCEWIKKKERILLSNKYMKNDAVEDLIGSLMSRTKCRPLAKTVPAETRDRTSLTLSQLSYFGHLKVVVVWLAVWCILLTLGSWLFSINLSPTASDKCLHMDGVITHTLFLKRPPAGPLTNSHILSIRIFVQIRLTQLLTTATKMSLSWSGVFFLTDTGSQCVMEVLELLR